MNDYFKKFQEAIELNHKSRYILGHLGFYHGDIPKQFKIQLENEGYFKFSIGENYVYFNVKDIYRLINFLKVVIKDFDIASFDGHKLSEELKEPQLKYFGGVDTIDEDIKDIFIKEEFD